MSNFKKFIALALAIVMALTVFAACAKKPVENPTSDDTTTDAAPVDTKDDKPLVVGYSNFNAKFSPR